MTLSLIFRNKPSPGQIRVFFPKKPQPTRINFKKKKKQNKHNNKAKQNQRIEVKKLLDEIEQIHEVHRKSWWNCIYLSFIGLSWQGWTHRPTRTSWPNGEYCPWNSLLQKSAGFWGIIGHSVIYATVDRVKPREVRILLMHRVGRELLVQCNFFPLLLSSRKKSLPWEGERVVLSVDW